MYAAATKQDHPQCTIHGKDEQRHGELTERKLMSLVSVLLVNDPAAFEEPPEHDWLHLDH